MEPRLTGAVTNAIAWDYRSRAGLDSDLDTRSRVTVAEDQLEMRLLLRDLLLLDGFEVTLVENGLALLEAVEKDRTDKFGDGGPDLIIADVRMPGLSGLQALARLRESDWSTPVIIITAFGDPQTHLEALRLGASRVLDKPFSVVELRHAVLELLGRL